MANPIFSFDKLTDGLRRGLFRKICVVTGAGISVSAGIPDFRSPGIGLYYNLEKYKLPNPEAIFDITYFKQNPQAYYSYCHERWKRRKSDTATPTHFFIKLLADRNLLYKHFT